MNPVYLQIASDGILFLISAGVAVYLFVTRKSQVNSDRIDALEGEFYKRLNQLSDRVTQVEVSRPTLEKLSKSVGQVHSRIDETKDMVSRLEGEFQASNRTLGLIHEYLLNKGKG